PIRNDATVRYKLPPSLPLNYLAYGGLWRVEKQRAVASLGAELELSFEARGVHLVLGGHGTVEVFLDGRRLGSVRVTEDKLYTLVSLPRVEQRLLRLRFAPGVEAYAFTF